MLLLRPLHHGGHFEVVPPSKSLLVPRRVARIWKKGGGLFWKSEKSANGLDPNFHCSWISFTRFVRKLRRNFSESSEFQTFFQPKTRWSPKKKVFTEIESDFSAKNGNSTVFSAQKQVVSKKKKKRSSPKLGLIFRPKSKIKNAFSHRITTSTSRLRHPFSFVGGCFQFLTKNRLQKHQKRAILHTSQVNGGAWAPPGYATACASPSESKLLY